MNIHLKTILAMVTAFSVAMVPQSHAFAFGEVQVDEEYRVTNEQTSIVPGWSSAHT